MRGQYKVEEANTKSDLSSASIGMLVYFVLVENL